MTETNQRRARAQDLLAAGRPGEALPILDDLLARQPREVELLLLKADALLRLQRRAEAASFLNAALQVAPPPAQRSAALAERLTRARGVLQSLLHEYEAHLRARLQAAGFDAAPDRSTRASETVDILFGRRRVQLQQPEQLYFPGLPQLAFYERERFPWAAAVEAQTAAIRAEARALAARLEQNFSPYQHADLSKPRTRDSRLLDSMDWSAVHLIRGGEVDEALAAQCPATMATLARLPLCRVPGRNPNVLFSRLAPGTRIDPHHGVVNTRLICHLPLVVPDGCTLRVGNYRYPHRTGELLVFDDSMEHEAENPSAEERIVLIFDIWRPELSAEDRALVAAMHQAIDAYQRPSG